MFQNVTDKNHADETVLTIVQGKGTLPREQAGRNIHYDNASLSNYKMVQKGDFIIHLRSFEGGLEIANENGIVSPAYTILRGKKPHSSRFYEAYFHTDEFINHILSKSVEGIRDGRQISYDAFKWLSIPYCNPNEQEKIADLFSTLSRRIEKQSALVDSLKKYKRGLLSFAFEEMSISDNANAITYLFSEIAQRRKEKYCPDSGVEYPCIELEHIEQGTGRLLGSVSSTAQSSTKTVAKTGDVLFGKLRPYLRKFAFAEQDMVCSSEIWVFVPSKYVLPKYLYYLIQTEHFMQVANISSGTKMPRAEWENIEKEPFDIPCISVQEQIVSIMEALDNEICLSDDIIRSLSNAKTGLLQQLFI